MFDMSKTLLVHQCLVSRIYTIVQKEVGETWQLVKAHGPDIYYTSGAKEYRNPKASVKMLGRR